jgi:hypothetical protein
MRPGVEFVNDRGPKPGSRRPSPKRNAFPDSRSADAIRDLLHGIVAATVDK